MGCVQVDAVAQNDVAKILRALLIVFPKLKFLGELANFFDALNAEPSTQSLLDGPCEAALIDGVKNEIGKLIAALPSHVQTYINCKLGFTSHTDDTTQRHFAQIAGLWALLPQLAKHWPQILMLLQHLPQILKLLQDFPKLMQLIEQLFKNGGAGGIVSPIMPNAGYSPRDVQRCS